MKYKKMSPGLILVDSALIKWAFQPDHYHANELALHSILRATYRNGAIPFRDMKGSRLAELIGVTEPTARKRLKYLIAIKWLTVNNKARIYRIVSIKSLLKRYKLPMSQAALLKITKLKGIRPIGPFIGAFIGFQNKMQSKRGRNYSDGRQIIEKGGAIPLKDLMIGKDTSPVFYPKCTDKRLSKNLGVNVKKAYRLKQLAKAANCIQIEKMARFNPGLLSYGEMNLYLKHNWEDSPYIDQVETKAGTFRYLRAAAMVTSFIPVLARRWVSKRKKVS